MNKSDRKETTGSNNKGNDLKGSEQYTGKGMNGRVESRQENGYEREGTKSKIGFQGRFPIISKRRTYRKMRMNKCGFSRPIRSIGRGIANILVYGFDVLKPMLSGQITKFFRDAAGDNKRRGEDLDDSCENGLRCYKSGLIDLEGSKGSEDSCERGVWCYKLESIDLKGSKGMDQDKKFGKFGVQARSAGAKLKDINPLTRSDAQVTETPRSSADYSANKMGNRVNRGKLVIMMDMCNGMQSSVVQYVPGNSTEKLITERSVCVAAIEIFRPSRIRGLCPSETEICNLNWKKTRKREFGDL